MAKQIALTEIPFLFLSLKPEATQATRKHPATSSPRAGCFLWIHNIAQIDYGKLSACVISTNWFDIFSNLPKRPASIDKRGAPIYNILDQKVYTMRRPVPWKN